MTEYVTGQIYGWNGGECPVHPETVVEVWFRGQSYQSALKATYLEWEHDNSTGDIITFQVVTPYVEPKAIWVNEHEDGELYAYPSVEIAKKYADGGITRVAVKYVEEKK